MKHSLLLLAFMPFYIAAESEDQPQISSLDAELLHMKGPSTVITKKTTENEITYIYVDKTTNPPFAMLPIKMICTKEKNTRIFRIQVYTQDRPEDPLLAPNPEMIMIKSAYNLLKALYILKKVIAARGLSC